MQYDNSHINFRKHDSDALWGHDLEDQIRALPQGFSEVTEKVTLKLHVWQAENERRIFWPGFLNQRTVDIFDYIILFLWGPVLCMFCRISGLNILDVRNTP